MSVEPPFLDDRGWRGIGISLLNSLRLGDLEELDVVNDLARVRVDRDGIILMPVVRGGGHPDEILPDDGRRPTAIVDGCLPDDMLGLAPGKRQANGVRAAIPPRPTKLRPVVIGRGAK